MNFTINILQTQPRPLCKNCIRYCGKTGTRQNGRDCVYCRIADKCTITPLRGPKTKTPIPCTYYYPKYAVIP